ncbi:MAG: hypothetical protein HY466_00945 [Deltaproteobacteria bacterium]|nr:hypothetical protein [Deltaproteobacteria bacterium]
MIGGDEVIRIRMETYEPEFAKKEGVDLQVTLDGYPCTFREETRLSDGPVVSESSFVIPGSFYRCENGSLFPSNSQRHLIFLQDFCAFRGELEMTTKHSGAFIGGVEAYHRRNVDAWLTAIFLRVDNELLSQLEGTPRWEELHWALAETLHLPGAQENVVKPSTKSQQDWTADTVQFLDQFPDKLAAALEINDPGDQAAALIGILESSPWFVEISVVSRARAAVCRLASGRGEW